MNKEIGDGPRSEDRKSSLDRMLDILTLYDEGSPVWTVEAVLSTLGYSRATAYRYVRSLCRVGLLDPVAGGGYVLGPAVLEWEHLVRSADPLLEAAVPIADRVRSETGATVLIARPYRDRVLTIYVSPGDGGPPADLDRGRNLPRFQGAPSRVVLAHLGARRLRALWEHEGEAMVEAGLGDSLDAVRAVLSRIRYDGHCETAGALAPGVAATAAPILTRDGAVLGSVATVVRDPRGVGVDALSDEAILSTVEAAAEVTRALRGPENPLGAPSRIGTGPPPARHGEHGAVGAV